jgi:hypothetical protein
MIRETLVRRVVPLVAAVVCAALAVGLALVAVDAARWRNALPAGDVRYRVAPEDENLWAPGELAPRGVTKKAIGVEDDLEFRSAVRAMRESRLDEPILTDPELALKRTEAQARLEAIVTGDMDPVRRSRAANLLGALGLARLGSDSQDRAATIVSVLANLRLALELDPSNDDAKYNLELALARSSGVELAEAGGGANPAPGGRGIKGAGAGDPGTGY